MLLDEVGWNVVNMRDRRYDLVLYIAKKLPKDYQLVEQPLLQFSEEIEIDETVIDRRLQDAWLGHQNFK